MKQLKSSIEDLREIFEKGINAGCITEPLCSFDKSTTAQNVKKILNENNYDVVGVRTNGIINGYAYKIELAEGQLGKYFNEFDLHKILPDTISIAEVLKLLNNSNHIFISSFGIVSGIITRGDLQKMPIRMWLFSLISLIEMQMLRIIREQFPDKSWVTLISTERKEKAENLLRDRKNKNEEIDLVDCLEFCDEYKIISKMKDLLEKLPCCKKKKEFCAKMKEFRELRDNLAHSQDIITASWPNIINLSNTAEKFLTIFETFNSGKNNKDKN